MLIGDRSFIRVIASSISVRFYYSLNLVTWLLKKLWRGWLPGKAICNDLQEIIFRESWKNHEIGGRLATMPIMWSLLAFLWQTLSNALEVKLQRTTTAQAINETRKTGIQPKTYRKHLRSHPTPYTPSSQDWGEEMDVSVFMDALRIDNIGSMDYSRAVPFSCNFRDRRYWQNCFIDQTRWTDSSTVWVGEDRYNAFFGFFCSIVWLMFLQAIKTRLIARYPPTNWKLDF